MLDVLLAALLAAVVCTLCLTLGLPPVAGTAAAILVFVTAVGSRGYGLRRGSRV
jgi:hypothetical protein